MTPDNILLTLFVIVLAAGWIRYLHVVVNFQMYAKDSVWMSIMYGIMLVFLIIFPLASLVGLAYLWDSIFPHK